MPLSKHQALIFILFLAPGSHLCCHKGESVHPMGSSQQTTDHSQTTAVQQQGDQQTKHSDMAVHGRGGRERQL